MKSFAFLCSFLLLGLGASAQFGANPIAWTFTATQVETNTYLLSFEADAESGWYVYSQHLDDGGPIPTSFEFSETSGLKMIGEIVEEGIAVKAFDETFNMELTYFKNTVSFQQKVELTGDAGVAKGTLTFMTCNGETCLPPRDVEFSFNVSQ
ncbi:MAG: protein-disulfide reductase DsbD domain-containing protein [Bacteroidota bacterium]